MSILEKMKAEMLNLSQKLKLPEVYAGDVEQDLTLIEQFSGYQMLWVLRTCGSALIPLKAGVHPVHVTHWIWGNSGQQIFVFHVNTQHGTIEKVDFEEAERLIMQQPCHLSSSMKREEIISYVDRVLSNGCNLRIWGVFDSPKHSCSVGGWSQWQQYFRSSGNHLMADFIGKAIRFTNPR
ncbi:hypothetical protein DDN39_01120 [Vibrio cholerae]|nr:hypothetical protein [Vibrio cholerae]